MADDNSLAGRPGILRMLRELADIPAVIAAPLRPAQRASSGGSGQPVLVIPGFLCSDATTSLLRRSIDAAGMQSFGWGMGYNLKIAGDTIARLKARVDAVRAATGGRDVILLGWSLGGLFARRLATQHPDGIAMVMTLGSPFCGDMRANNAWRLIEMVNARPLEQMPMPTDFSAKPPVHTVAVWSPRDGIVAPHGSRGEPGQSDERIEIACTHMGFAVSAAGVRDVVRLLVERA